MKTSTFSALLVGTALSLLICTPLPATTWYVDDSVSSSGDGESWPTAFQTIQEGIDAASDNDTVIVGQGIYVENIQFKGKNIILTSTDPIDPTTIAHTIIDGNQTGSVVTFSGTEDETCALSGFTIRNGTASEGAGVLGGTTSACTRAKIQNNFITQNSAQRYGGGLYRCNGTIRNNTVMANSACWGGGLSYCGGTVQNNTITGNSASTHGGGLFRCDGTIQNNLIAGNSGRGGGLSYCGGIIQNNTIASNSASWEGGGLYECRGAIRNCIIWGNTATERVQLSHCVSPSHCCIEDWMADGEGNITQDPLFANASGGDYHLQAESPCIDTGVNFYWSPWPQRDLGGNCRLQGPRVDMGCYEYDSLQDADGDLLSDVTEAAAGTNPNNNDSDGDGLRDGLEALRGTDPSQANSPGVILVPTEVPRIQQALCIAIEGDEIVVAPGTYDEKLELCGQGVVLRSTEPTNPDVVASTIFDRNQAGSVVTFFGTEDETCVLSGFTIRNGKADYGAGILGGTLHAHTHATIENNLITGNSANRYGGGLYRCDGTIRNNTITLNSSGSRGGGIYDCDATIQNNTITQNSADYGGGLCECVGTIHENTIADNIARYGGGLSGCRALIQDNMIAENLADNGGGLHQCDGMIHGNIITGNTAGRYGGGVNWCLATIQNNRILENSALRGGGLYDCNRVIQNNLIVGNSALEGGGLCQCHGTVQNNTILNNMAEERGGGLCRCGGALRNCIVWGNSAPQGAQLFWSPSPLYSCVEGWSGGGKSTITNDPLFVDASAGNYRLQPGSPCIDSGVNFYWSAWPQRDLDGYSRLQGPAVDMGCYEYNSSPDADGDLLSDVAEVAVGTNPDDRDSDGDGLGDGLEGFRGTNPLQVTIAGTILVSDIIPLIQQALSVALTGDEIVVSPGTYTENLEFHGPDLILRSTDPENPSVVASTVIDGGGTARAVRLFGAESPACLLAGLTIRNGSSHWGTGIDGRGSAATIRNNLIMGNSALEQGGGVYNCSGTIEGNIISENFARQWGGGLGGCNGTIQRNTISANSVELSGGGGVYACDGTIQNNTIMGNSGGEQGGGLYDCLGIIRNNRISGNRARYGGGLCSCDGIIHNNTVIGNSARSLGGGLRWCETIQNCVVWANVGEHGATDEVGAQLSHSDTPSYSCIHHWNEAGDGNINAHPQFVSSGHWDHAGTPADPKDDVWVDGDYHLLPASPCVDTGMNEDWMILAIDLDGGPRITLGRTSLTVDMGAYEYRFGVRQVVSKLGGAFELTWRSTAGSDYTVWWRSDMAAGKWAAAETISSQGNFTSWIDDGSKTHIFPSAVSHRFYRIVHNP